MGRTLHIHEAHVVMKKVGIQVAGAGGVCPFLDLRETK